MLPTVCLQKWRFRLLWKDPVQILLALPEDGFAIDIEIVIATLTTDSITVAIVLTSMVPPNSKSKALCLRP